MTTQSTTTEAALEPCWCFRGIKSLSIKSNIDHGDFGCRERGRYVYCSNCWTHGPTFTNDEKAVEGWNRSRIPAPSVAPEVDHVGLAEWLDMLVTALKASQKYDYNEWGQFIMGAESWVNKLRAPASPVAPVENVTHHDPRWLWCGRCQAWIETSHLCGAQYIDRGSHFELVAEAIAPVEQSDDGWVTFGRVKVDIENETETFERIDPPAAPASPAAQLLHCSCGAACAPDEYAAHRAMGHDAPVVLRDEAEPAEVVRYATGYETKDLMDNLVSSINEIAQQGWAQCKLCEFKAHGSLSEVFEQMGQHGDVAHAATTPPSTRIQAAAEEIADLSYSRHREEKIAKYVEIIERCLSGGGEDQKSTPAGLRSSPL